MAPHAHTHTHTHTHSHAHTLAHTHTLLHRDDFFKQRCFYKGLGLHEELLDMDVITQAYFCMISDCWHVFRATSVRWQLHRSFWRLRWFSWERVDPVQAHIAISFQFLAIDIWREGVAFYGHQSTSLCFAKINFPKNFELVGVSTVRSC